MYIQKTLELYIGFKLCKSITIKLKFYNKFLTGIVLRVERHRLNQAVFNSQKLLKEKDLVSIGLYVIEPETSVKIKTKKKTVTPHTIEQDEKKHTLSIHSPHLEQNNKIQFETSIKFNRTREHYLRVLVICDVFLMFFFLRLLGTQNIIETLIPIFIYRYIHYHIIYNIYIYISDMPFHLLFQLKIQSH